MKKIICVALLGFFALKSFAQAGDLTVGAQGGYITYYKNFLYGLNLSYAPSGPLQLTLSGVMNPNITRPDKWDPNRQIKNALYSLNLDARFLLLDFGTFATGPSVGVQYMHNIQEISFPVTYNAYGANLGWHVKFNLTDYLRFGGGWQYSTMKNSSSYNMFYASLGWAFNVR
ncbi:MAG: hypothetical protein LBS25_01520 [Candidatus Symbiothrix sp.]|jgi:hypothetical protein|nr:hypothetical protein [Candidatus Symbiothrix sp.]